MDVRCLIKQKNRSCLGFKKTKLKIKPDRTGFGFIPVRSGVAVFERKPAAARLNSGEAGQRRAPARRRAGKASGGSAAAAGCGGRGGGSGEMRQRRGGRGKCGGSARRERAAATRYL